MRLLLAVVGMLWACADVTAAPKTPHITVSDAVIYQRGPDSTGYVVFTLRARWQNNGVERVTIFFDVHFYDASRTELYVKRSARDVDAKGATIAPAVLATFRGKSSDDFDYRAVRRVLIRYKAKGDETEATVDNVPIRPE